MSRKLTRQDRIRDLIARNRIASQEQLMELLRAESIDTTQATLSRDLRELGIAKRNGSYVLPQPGGLPRSERKELERSLRSAVTSAERAGNLVVLRTGPGLARAVAIRLDQASLSQVVGTIAGTDTVMVATPSWSQAEEFARLVRRLARLPRD